MKRIPGPNRTPEILESAGRNLTQFLQKFDSGGTHVSAGGCLMKRCQRILQPTLPNMKKIFIAVVACLSMVPFSSLASPRKAPRPETGLNESPVPAPASGLLFAKVTYEAKVSDDEARVTAEISVESAIRQQAEQPLFEGDLALLPSRLPAGLQIERTGNTYNLLVAKPGRYNLKVELLAKVKHLEPWNQISFTGPAAAIGSVTAEAKDADVDLQLLNGTLMTTARSNGVMRVSGLLGAERTVALRWSRAGGLPEVARKAVVTADTAANLQITPTVIHYVTQIRYDILQGKNKSPCDLTSRLQEATHLAFFQQPQEIMEAMFI